MRIYCPYGAVAYPSHYLHTNMRTIYYTLFLCLMLFFVSSSGCSSSATQAPPSPAADEALRSAQSILESCVRTGKRGNELENYQSIVDALRSARNDKANILEQGFEELLAVPESEIKATAKRIMAQAQLESDVD